MSSSQDGSEPTGSDAATPVRLRSRSGGAMPDELARDAQRLDRLTDGAIAALKSILRACVLEPMTAEIGEQLSRLCLRHEVAEADLGHVIKVCRWLLREASAADLPAEDLEADVRAIWRKPNSLAELLLDEYEGIKQELRKQLLQDALEKHGNVLVDVDWRVDLVATERHSPKLMLPIALVTLRYRNADGPGRLTLQLSAEQLVRLQQIFGALAQRTLSPVPRVE